MTKKIDALVLEMALVGYRGELQKLEDRMANIRKQLGMRVSRTASSVARGAKAKRGMSAAGRKHIAEAQRKRWAAYHAKHNATAKRAAQKGKMSAHRTAVLAANLAKARAAKAVKKAAV